MQWFQSKAMVGALALAAMVFAPAQFSAQTPAKMPVPITVTDARGGALPGVTVKDSSGKLFGTTDADGRLVVPCAAPCLVRVTVPGFESETALLTAGMVLQLQPASKAEQVTITAYRTPLGSLESPATTVLLSQSALSTTAAVTLDDQLRQIPGVELFRRSSSLVANPSSQGISLRALGSTSASRTLLTEDDVPLNDAFAGTIHWQEQPELAIKSIELLRGGASDLYGSSAIGGVVSVVPDLPTVDQGELRSSGGSEGTYDDSLLLQTKHGPWGLLAAGGALGTDGYIQESPAQRGPVDIASNAHSQNGEFLADHKRGSLRILARGSGFNEARNNGTPFQTNGTRLWRYATGGDWQGPRNALLVTRFYGSTEHFRQTFSSISNLPDSGDPTCSYRCGEIPSKFSLTPDNELGAVAHWSQPFGAGVLLLAGADTHDVRVWDREQSYASSAALTNLHDHQRDSAAYAEAMAVRKAWTLTAAGRMDWFQNYDGQSLTQSLIQTGSSPTPSASQPPQFDQRFFDPRLGLSRKFRNHWAAFASGFRAFREPSPNELYRATQVGNQLTLANGNLLSERATGWETGVATESRWGSVRASYFLTQVNRPITTVTLNATSSPMLLMRENLGQIESRGLSLDYELAPLRWLILDGGYQYANATVSQGNQYLGNWIPEVARNLATLNLRASRPKLGTLSLQSRLSGRQFDDAANQYLLHGYFRLDAYGSHDLGKRLQLFAAGENLLNRQIEDSKTPTTTLGMPRIGRIGLTIRLGKSSQ
jgi:outer membrane receptor protein involved in Fe transport